MTPAGRTCLRAFFPPGKRAFSRGVVLISLGLGFHFSCWRAEALPLTPFQTFNQSPLVQVYGLPTPGNATTLPPRKADLRLTANVASNFVEETGTRETLQLDGETYRFDLVFRYGLPGRFEVSADIPYLTHQKGFLDGFIEGWHDFFNLPQGGRNQAPENQLAYRYTRNGEEKINVDHAASGLGDVRLGAAWQLLGRGEGKTCRAALHVGLKLPTGDSDKLLGSGSADFASWLTADRFWPLSAGSIGLFGSGGILLLTNGDLLPGQQRNVVGFGSLGTGWSPLQWLAFKVQFDGHTPFYRNSALSELDGGSVQLTIGGTLGFLQTMALDIGVSEDIVVNTSPDVVFHFSLSQSF